MDKDIKIRPLYIAKILYELTDEDHVLTTNDIVRILDEEYYIHAHRITVAEDVEVLKNFGLDIQVRRSSQNEYNIVNRDFEDAEIKMLIDAVESAKFISKEKSQVLVNKIAKIAGKNRAAEMKRNVSVERRYKTENKLILTIVDAINTAINHNKQIAFQYFEFSPTKERKLRYDGYTYQFSPYRLVWNGDFYYVVGFSEKHQIITSFRVDRIADIPEELDIDIVPIPKDYDLDNHLNTMFHMFSTERQKIELICSNETMDSIIDRFGEDVETHIYDSENFMAKVNIAVNNVFYSWVFGFGGKVWIKEPEYVKKEYSSMIKEEYIRVNKMK